MPAAPDSFYLWTLDVKTNAAAKRHAVRAKKFEGDAIRPTDGGT
jgi:hypothetical protein